IAIASATNAVATGSTASIAVTVARAVTVAVASGAATAKVATKRRRRSKHHAVRSITRSPPVLPPPQDVPVHRRQRAEDRLQGRQAAAALRLRARQDRAEPHHRGLDQEAARTLAGDQAGALPGPAALRDALRGLSWCK